MSLKPMNNQDMAYFGASDTQTIITNTLDRGVVTISHICAREPLGYLNDAAQEDAIMVAYQHRPLQADLFLDDRHIVIEGRNVGNITLYDYRLPWGCAINTGFEATNFYVPRAVLDCLSDDGAPSGDLIIKPGVCVDDAVIRGLVVAMEAVFEHGPRHNSLFLDHIGWALAAHCAANFLENTRPAGLASGGLAPWQERLAKDMIASQLDGKIRLADLAAECGLSVSHFSRAFRRSTSVPPHQWLTHRRIDCAQNLLLTTHTPIAQIALDCGFNDQSHFTTVFRRVVGMSPAEWRRARRN